MSYKILYTKIADKMSYANSIASDQTAPDQGLYGLPFHEFSVLRNNCIKSKN